VEAEVKPTESEVAVPAYFYRHHYSFVITLSTVCDLQIRFAGPIGALEFSSEDLSLIY